MKKLIEEMKAKGYEIIPEAEGISTVVNGKVIAIEDYSFMEGSGWWINGNGAEKMFAKKEEAIKRYKEIIGLKEE